MASNPQIIDEPAADPATDPTPAPDPAGDPPVADPNVNDNGDPAPAGDPPAFDFAKDWRAAVAQGDDKLTKFLARVPSPKAAIERLKTIEDDIKAGKYRKPLGDDATDEEKAAERKLQGVPDASDGYYSTLPDGLVVGDDDKPFVGKFLDKMHAVGAKPAEVNAALETYYDIIEEQAEAQADVARQAEQEGVEALRGEWGADYKRNLNAMHAHLDTLPKAVGDAFRFGKGADGVPLGYNPDVLKWLTGLALEANPLSTVVPGAGANQASAIADEMAKIEKMMREDRTAYNKDAKVQARYRELIEAKQKIDARS